MSLLEVNNLTVSFGEHHVVRDVSFAVQPSEQLGVIDEILCSSRYLAGASFKF